MVVMGSAQHDFLHGPFGKTINGVSEKIQNKYISIFAVQTANGPRMEPEPIPKGPRTDPERTPNEPQTNPERTPKGEGVQGMYIESLFCLRRTNSLAW